MARSPAAPNRNDDPAPTAAFSAAEVVGLCGGGGQATCGKFAEAIKRVVELYAKDTLYVRTFVMLWNTQRDDRALARLEEAATGEPMDEVDPEGRTFKSIVSITDDRADLMLPESEAENYKLEVAVMASKFVYENMARAKDLVTTKLEGRDFEFFDCPNLGLEEVKTTQAMAFVRKEGERNVVYVAFRGSSELNDWRANLDCGHIQVSDDFGNLHVGFMKALGLVRDTGSFDDRFPNELPREKWKNPPAYYAVRQWLACEVERLRLEEANAPGGPKIALRVVGHSLGGALAILFVAMLRYHKGGGIPAVSSLEVITLGQPRVGDSTFANYMTDKVFKPSNSRITYKRMVYSYDAVPRVPGDDDPDRTLGSYSIYRHFGTCLYYKGWFAKQRFTDDSRMDYPNVSLAYGAAAYSENQKEKERAWRYRVRLQEPPSVVSGRKDNLFLLQFHTVGEYLNAARHGDESEPRSLSLVRRLLRSLLHYPTSSFWNRSRRRRVVIAATDDVDVSSYV